MFHRKNAQRNVRFKEFRGNPQREYHLIFRQLVGVTEHREDVDIIVRIRVFSSDMSTCDIICQFDVDLLLCDCDMGKTQYKLCKRDDFHPLMTHGVCCRDGR